VFEDVGRWTSLKKLPSYVDVDVVMSSVGMVDAQVEGARDAFGGADDVSDFVSTAPSANAAASELMASDRACAI
jgi:hypothetical protein